MRPVFGQGGKVHEAGYEGLPSGSAFEAMAEGTGSGSIGAGQAQGCNVVAGACLSSAVWEAAN